MAIIPTTSSGATVLTLHTYDGPVRGYEQYYTTLPALPGTIHVQIGLNAPIGLTTDVYGTTTTAVEWTDCSFDGIVTEGVVAATGGAIPGFCGGPSTGVPSFPCTASAQRVAEIMVLTGNCSYRKDLTFVATVLWAVDLLGFRSADLTGVMHIGP